MDLNTFHSQLSETRLRKIIEQSPVSTQFFAPDGRVLDANKAWEQLFGVTLEQIADYNVLEDPQLVATGLMPLIRRGFAGETLELPAIPYRPTVGRYAGEARWCAAQIFPIKNDAGAIEMIVLFHYDLTAQKHAEESRRRSAEIAQAMYQVTSALTGELDTQKIVQVITDAGTRLSKAAFGAFFYNVINDRGESYMLYTLSGVPREAFSKFPMPRATDLFGPTFRGEGTIRLADVTKDPRYGHWAPHHGMPQGHLPVRSYLAVPVKSRSGEVLGGLFFGHPEVGVFTQEAEDFVNGIAGQAAVVLDNARLYMAQGRLAAIVASSDDAIVSKTLEGIITSWNEGATRILGYTPEEAVGKSILLIVPPERHDEERTILRKLRAGERIDHYETERVAKDGRRVHLSLTVSPVKDSSGTIIGASKIARDISDRKRNEVEREALLQSERHARGEAERASRLKDDFLATLSHELRTPLNAILGWAQILRREATGNADLEEGLTVIERNCRVQVQLVEDLLDMSRIISGKLKLNVQQVYLPEVVRAAIESVAPAAEAKDVQLIQVLDTQGGAVRGDPARLQQVVWNLLTNAIKFTPKGGKVQVSLERVNSHLEVTVSDTGQGIRPDFLPHVFDRFRQEDGSTTRRHGGLGLGLSIVRQLVELHGGSVRAKSTGEGKGSTFVVMLPLMVVHETPDEGHGRGSGTPIPDCDTNILNGLRVLVVDDEPDSRELVRRVLEDCRALVRVAGSAREALVMLQEEKPDVVLSDIGMPEHDGYEFIRWVRGLSAEQGGRTPAAALTAFARSEDRRRALLSGYQAHVAKPVEPQELIAVVASLAGRT